jgi:hypothetical protein
MRLLRVDELTAIEGGAAWVGLGTIRKTGSSNLQAHTPTFQPPIVETHRSWDDRGWWNLEPRYWSLAR